MPSHMISANHAATLGDISRLAADIAQSAGSLKAARAAAAALSARCTAVVAVVESMLAGAAPSQVPAVRRALAQLAAQLETLACALARRAAWNGLLQLLLAESTARRIGELHAGLDAAAAVRSLPLRTRGRRARHEPRSATSAATAAGLSREAAAAAARADAEATQDQMAQTMWAINAHRGSLLTPITGPLRGRANQLLDATASHIAAATGSGVPPHASWCLDIDAAVLDVAEARGDAGSIGRGTIGAMFRSTMDGRAVCVEVADARIGAQAAAAIESVAAAWAAVNHPNVAPLRACIRADRPLVVMPALVEPLADAAARCSGREAALVGMLRDVARGMEHLHSKEPAVVHGGLTARSVMLCESVGEQLDRTAPEIRDVNGSATTMTDVFDFGMLAVEVLSGAGRDSAPMRPEYVSEWLWDLVLSCLRSDPSTRPSFASIAAALAVPWAAHTGSIAGDVEVLCDLKPSWCASQGLSPTFICEVNERVLACDVASLSSAKLRVVEWDADDRLVAL
ncbi:hypothetical protein HK105_208942 [Polyrhizophydium stewartii]|uniref:Protein kinase domain-containing protein n=1 Tax=Polyrhizophydium stewartii TaxID=2732419 RepID=A0ABR4MWG9_9FUNG